MTIRAVAIVLFLACLPLRAQVSLPELGISFPPRMGSMVFTGTTDYEKQGRGLGVGISYRASEAKADIYVYTAGLASIPDGIESPYILPHFDAVTDDVLELGRRGLYQDVNVVVKREPTSLGAHPFLHAELTFVQDGEPRISHIYLGAMKNRFVKIRFTYYASASAEGKRLLSDFLKNFSRLLPP